VVFAYVLETIVAQGLQWHIVGHRAGRQVIISTYAQLVTACCH
jgi:hypothetical protein